MRWKPLIIIGLVLISFIWYYQITGNTVKLQQSFVSRAIDGDTIVLDNNKHVRLLGINTPEKNQPFHDEAMNYLKSLVENKTVDLEIQGVDKYQRILAYIYKDNQLINKKQLEQGYANLYYYGTDHNYEDMKNAELTARQNQLGLWKKSPNAECISLINLSYLDGGNCNNQEQLILNNNCQSMQVIIKDDANHIYDETIPKGIWQKNFSCIWNDAGDTIYIRDNQGLLLFYRY